MGWWVNAESTYLFLHYCDKFQDWAIASEQRQSDRGSAVLKAVTCFNVFEF